MAKIILSDQKLGQIAFKKFKEVIGSLQEDNLLKDGVEIRDMLDEFWRKKESFEVY